MSVDSITIDPPLHRWPGLLKTPPQGSVFDRSLHEWRELTRRELGLPVDRPIIATGHQPTLWHPGILAKYLAVDAIVRQSRGEIASLNVIVDQDVVDFAALDVPVRRSDGALASRQIEFASASPKDVPVGRVSAFAPRDVVVDSVEGVPEVPEVVARIRNALAAHSSDSSAAAQLAGALARLMTECAGIAPMPIVMASALMRTSLANAMLRAMADDPHRCAEAYNRAVATEPNARLTPLAIRDDYVELPIWRMRSDGTNTRIRGYDSDIDIDSLVVACQSTIQNPQSKFDLLPRALFMTALIRLAVADVFVHGRGGAMYDRAMERWIRDWLDVEVSPMTAASATLRLPLMPDEELMLMKSGGLAAARNRERLVMHDPEMLDHTNQADQAHPGPVKRELLSEVTRWPRRSHERRAAFFAMHQRLAAIREANAGVVESARAHIARLERIARDAVTAERRDWAFPLYPQNSLGELMERIRKKASA